MYRSKVIYVPAGVSSIFKIEYYKNRDLIFEGAKGGGFRIKLGTYTYAEINEKDEVIINGKKENAKTTYKVIELIKQRYHINENIRIVHRIEVPIGCGFGTSGSGSLGAVFAIADLFKIKDDYYKLASIAHEAEILALTGLGTVSGLASFKGAAGLITKEGAPGICEIKELEVKDDYLFVSVVFAPIPKDSIILSEEKKVILDRVAENLLRKIEEEGTAEALLKYSRIFAEKSGFLDDFLRSVIEKFIKLGFVDAAQNMIGKAVHGLINKEKFEEIKEKFYELFGSYDIVISELQYTFSI
jgi:pantoate kinase